jgi:oligopeptide transport system substrate-binding protein
MLASGRKLFPYVAVALLIGSAVWAVSFQPLEPADFTFINGSEVQSVDPHIVTGQPEGRVMWALYEGLVRWDAEDLRPIPGVAESWEISADGLTYTFHLRPDARWSDGSPITADDFVYSYRRFLEPMTGAEYAYLLYMVAGAEKYNRAEMEIGDGVEVELVDPPADALPFARGQVVRGTLRQREVVVTNEEDVILGERPREVFLFGVEVDGALRRFKTGKTGDLAAGRYDEYEPAEQVLPDFRSVGIKAIEPRTLQFQLRSPTPYFVKLTGFYPQFPVNRRCLETYGYPAWTRPENIVTNGPFRLHSRHIRDRIRMVKNEQYWDAANVHLNTVDVLAIESLTTAFNLYETGKADMLTDTPETTIPELLALGRSDFVPSPFLAVYFYRVNVTSPGLDDPRVRRALNLAIDKQMIVDKVTRAGQVPGRSLVPPGIAGYQPALCGQYDVEEARRLMREAGYHDGNRLPKITLLYNTNENHKKLAEVLQIQWKEKLGIEVELENKEWGAYLNSQRELEYDVARAGWIGDYSDPNTFLDMFVTGGENNQTGWSNAEYDRLIKQVAPNEQDPERRMQVLQQAERILMDELPIIPLYYYVSKIMVRPYVHGIYRTVQDVHPLNHVRVDKPAKARFLQELRNK